MIFRPGNIVLYVFISKKLYSCCFKQDKILIFTLWQYSFFWTNKSCITHLKNESVNLHFLSRDCIFIFNHGQDRDNCQQIAITYNFEYWRRIANCWFYFSYIYIYAQHVQEFDIFILNLSHFCETLNHNKYIFLISIYTHDNYNCILIRSVCYFPIFPISKNPQLNSYLYHLWMYVM